MIKLNTFIQDHFFVLLSIIMMFPFYIHVPVLVLIFIYFLLKKRELIIESVTSYPWISIFIIYVILVSLLKRNLLGSLLGLVYLFYLLLFSYYLSRIKPSEYHRILKTITLGSIPVALKAIYDYIVYSLTHGYGIFYIFRYHNIQIRAESTFLNANYYGIFVIFSILISIYLLMKRQGSLKINIVYLLSIILNFIVLILTGSRAFLPTLAVGIVWFLLWANRKWFLPALIIGVVGVAYLIIFPDTLPRFASLLYAFEDRFAIWEVGWNIFQMNPIFGNGDYGYFHLFHRFTTKSDTHAHQLYLNPLINYGVVGMSIFFIMLKSYGQKLINLLSDKRFRLIFALITSVIVIVLVHGLIDFAIYWTQTSYFFLVIILPVLKYKDFKEN